MPAPLREVVPSRRRPPLKGEPMEGTPGGGNAVKRTILPYSPVFAIVGILLGGIEQYIFNLPLFAQGPWTVSLMCACFPVVWRTFSAARQGNYATDLVASLSFFTAAIIGQPLAGLLIVLM